MTVEEIKSNLCRRDKRHPDYNPDDGSRRKTCYCDACFYGRDELAQELLILKEENEALRKRNNLQG
jgi:hypothetical protein